MKTVLTFLLCLLSVAGMGHNATFNKLAEVNKCWREQKDAPVVTAQAANEHEWIQLHLSLVEQTLRQRSTKQLNAQQAANRTACLDYLHEYWNAGNFPINEDYNYRTPIFIDKHDNFCAVGYLVKASGHEAVSRMISSKTNLAYVKQMHYPELNKWAEDYGFTVDELAWIQPGYPPVNYSAAVGKGVDGQVNELFADNDILYVGGNFTKADSTISASNIAYVTEAGGVYTWHSMGSGVNGPVRSIVKFDNKIFVAGDFSEAGGHTANAIAYWDGNAWHSMPCIYGKISSLVVFDNELYIAGNFDICAALSDVNFAKWTGSRWEQHWGIDGRINTMQVVGSSIVLGGAFKWQNNPLNVIKWTPNGSFEPFAGSIANEVMDFQTYQDTVYAVCNRTATTADSNNLFLKLQNNSWSAAWPTSVSYGLAPNGGRLSLNSLCIADNKLMVGGNFRYLPMMGYLAENCMDITPSGSGNGNWFLVDSAINKMVVYKGSLIAGGKFKMSQSPFSSKPPVILNGIARRSAWPNSVPGTPSLNEFSLYPNPVKNTGTMTVKNNFDAKYFTVTDLTGKVIARNEMQVQATQTISMPALASGVYLIELANDKGAKVVKKFTVE